MSKISRLLILYFLTGLFLVIVEWNRIALDQEMPVALLPKQDSIIIHSINWAEHNGPVDTSMYISTRPPLDSTSCSEDR